MSDYIETRMIEKVIVSLTPDEKQRIQRAAHREGMSMSRYLAEAALRQAEVYERHAVVVGEE